MSPADDQSERERRLTPSRSVDESPGVPLFQTWRAVYWFVFGCFIAGVVALTIFSRVYG